MFNVQSRERQKKMLGRRNYVMMTSCFRLIRRDWFAWLCRISVRANNNQSRYVIYSLADKQSVWNFELSWEKEQCSQKEKEKACSITDLTFLKRHVVAALYFRQNSDISSVKILEMHSCFLC